MLHALPEAKAENGKRPNNAAEVVGFHFLYPYQLSATGLEELAVFKNLQHLTIPELTPSTLKVVTSFKSLKHLAVGYISTNDYHGEAMTLKDLGQLKNLETLEIGGISLKIAYKDLAELKHLRVLIVPASCPELPELRAALPQVKIITKGG